MEYPVLDFDIVIVGLGPTGVTAANLLGRLGVRTLVIERDMAVYPRQRAIAIDEDALRIWQSLGLLEPLLADMRTAITLHLHHAGRIFLSCDLNGRGRQGLPGTCFFHQPLVENTLRVALPDLVTVRAGAELVSLTQDNASVEVGLRTVGGTDIDILRCRYVIGCDGGSSTVRKLLGIALLGQSIEEPWIDIQARSDVVHDPAARLDFNFICDPDRPGAECHAAPGLRRWEFRLRRDEDPARANTPQGLRALLAGRGVDPDTVDIVQSWIYVFHVRQAERWRQGRVFLCGDAAHIMPPFTGQGVSSGVRDAGNLCWKLACVLGGNLDGEASQQLLDSYESERRPNVMTVTRFSLRVGMIVMLQSRTLAACRDLAIRIAARLPWLGHHIRNFHIKPEWRAGPGLFAPKRAWRSPAGHLLWQPWVTPSSGYRRRLDDVLGPGWVYLAWEGSRIPAALADQGVREVIVYPRPRSWHGLAACEVVDIEDRLRRQFRRHRAKGMLVRPDRFIYGSDRDTLRLDDIPGLGALLPVVSKGPQ